MSLITIPGIGRFQPLKPGHIHMRCAKCYKTRSNVARSQFDFENAAVLVMSYCDRCDKGGGFEEAWYYDLSGKELQCT